MGRERTPQSPLIPEDYPTPEDINRSRRIKGELKKQKGAVSIPVTATLTGGALVVGGLGGYFINDALASENPSHTETTDSVPGGTSLDNSRLIIPSDEAKGKVFDPKAERQVITPGMIERLPEEELDKLDSFAILADQKTEIVTMAQGAPAADRAASPDNSFPDYKFQIGEHKNTILFLHPLDFSLSSNPNVKIEYIKSYGGMRQADSDYLKGKGYYDTIGYKGEGNSGIPEGAIVKMPVVSENGGYLVTKKGYGWVYFQADDGTSYSLMIIGEKGDKVVPFKPINKDTPEWIPEFNGKGIGNFGLPVTSSQAILQTTENLDRILIKINTASKDGAFVPTNIEFFTSPDGKLLAALGIIAGMVGRLKETGASLKKKLSKKPHNV